MNDNYVLSIAVPIYNMEKWLYKNLATYEDDRLIGRLEVICLNNASTDGSKEIIEHYKKENPTTFKSIDRTSRGYGSSINKALANAKGRYFRIIDADDWVDTEELTRLVDALEKTQADIVLTDYQIVNMKTGERTPVCAKDKGIKYGILFNSFQYPAKTLPSIHGTTYLTSLLRNGGLYLQDNIFFVDEEYVILPYLYAKNVIYYPFDVYRYQVANPAQSTSPGNRAKYLKHREKVLQRLIHAYSQAASGSVRQDALDYCFKRISLGVGDHFTTLYIYIDDKKLGRKQAREWKAWLLEEGASFYSKARLKQIILNFLNLCHISLHQYERLKRAFLWR